MIGIALNLVDQVGKNWHLDNIKLIHKYGISLHLFSSTLISFISVVVFLVYIFHFFFRFIPKYFILGGAIVNGTVFNVKFQLFIAGMQDNDWLLYINLVSWNLAKIVYSSSSFCFCFIIDSFNFLHRWLCHLWTNSVLFLPSQSVYFYSLFLYYFSKDIQYTVEKK